MQAFGLQGGKLKLAKQRRERKTLLVPKGPCWDEVFLPTLASTTLQVPVLVE